MAKPRAPKLSDPETAAPEAPPVDLAHALEVTQAALLEATKAKDAAYAERNRVLAALTKCVRALNYPTWLGKHPESDAAWDPEWRTIVFMLCPLGQMSWHIHDSEVAMFDGCERAGDAWDGHTTEQKYERLKGWKPALRRT